MTHGRTERGRGEPGHHGGPQPALRRRDAILAWSTRRSDLPSVATSLGRRMPTRRKSKWDATTRSSRIRCVRETGVGVAPQRGDAAGSGVRSTPRGHLDFLQRFTSLGYEVFCPVSVTGASACSGLRLLALVARFRPPFVEPVLSVCIAYLAPQRHPVAIASGRTG